ncbi:MAG TPA: glycosyltransferase, partial [Ardenticatenaceae bacterium]|nr:glycosyltransferase [Ardenticatenaceae bacterium]
RAGIHVHFYGRHFQQWFPNWTRDGVATGYMHLYPTVEPADWVRELSQYDAAWFHIFESFNGGDLRRAHWDDLNLPARLGTYAAAGLPWILKDNRHSRVAIQSIAQHHDVGIFYKDFEDLTAQLRDRPRLEQLTANMRAARCEFAFDPFVDDLIALFRKAIERRRHNGFAGRRQIPRAATVGPAAGEATPGVLCISHLNWDYVWQRPQQLLSRMARHYPVLFVHEPRYGPTHEVEPYLHPIADEGNLSAWQPVYPARGDVFERWREIWVGLVQDLLLRHGWIRHEDGVLRAERPLILWFYTPMPVYFVDHVPADVVVYDVMDELANFKYAPGDIRVREERLLARADLVFTGGRSLYESRAGRHPNLFLFASGVDPQHFARALDPATEIASEIASLPHPILGYYGVIDERIDLDLIHELAARHPEWTIVLVGPAAKIELHQLPQLPNIIYTGPQHYERLPSFLKGFDVCLMPFAINEATRHISPTKTLEYMAAHKPIVSTPVPDVVANWSDVVVIASGPHEFAAAVEAALHESEAGRAERIRRTEAIVAASTWDHISESMRAHIEAVLSRQGAPAVVQIQPGSVVGSAKVQGG